MSQTQKDPKVYHLRYEAALSRFEDDLQGCISAARHNLFDSGIPPYYVIKNSILVASALDDWRDADIFRAIAENVYRKSLSKATSEHDEASLKLLEGLARELKALNRFRDEDMFELTGIWVGFDGALDDDTNEMDDTEDYEEMDVFPDGYSDFSEDDVQHKALDGAVGDEDGGAAGDGDGAATDFELPVRTKEAPTVADAAERISPVNANTLAPNDCKHAPPQEELL